MTAVAGKATEIGRLGTTDAVADLALLGTSDAVADMNTLGTSSNVTNMNTLAGISSNITTVAGIQANVTTVAGNNSNVTTVAGSIADVNRYANEYKIASSAPSSPSQGDLWYDSSNTVLKYRSASAWESISAGIADVVQDTTPQLGGALDGQNNNMSNIGTIDGSNLQLDFGTL